MEEEIKDSFMQHSGSDPNSVSTSFKIIGIHQYAKVSGVIKV
jgi:hypothetical protein